MNCYAELCDNESAMAWERYCTEEEIAEHQLPPQSRVIVAACADHLLSLDDMARIHASTCAAPPTCTCPVSEPLPTKEITTHDTC